MSRNSLGADLGHVRIKFGELVRNEEINSSSGENLKLLLGHSTMKGTSHVSSYLVNFTYSCFLCLHIYETMNSSIVGCSLLSHLGSKVHVVFVQAVFIYQGKNRKVLTSIALRVYGVNLHCQSLADVSFHFLCQVAGCTRMEPLSCLAVFLFSLKMSS